MDMDSYKGGPVNVIAIKLYKEGGGKENIKFSQVRKKVRGDYNINLQYSNVNEEDVLKEIRDFIEI